MTRAPLIIALAAAAALAGCNSENHNIVAGSVPDDNAPSDAGVQLPPSIVASKIYRCADNTIVYVDWLSDNKSAHVRTDRGGPPTMVMAAQPGQPMAGPAGFSLEGNATSGAAKIGIPGHPAQSCKA